MNATIPFSWPEVSKSEFDRLLGGVNWKRDTYSDCCYYTAKGQEMRGWIAGETDDGHFFINPRFFSEKVTYIQQYCTAFQSLDGSWSVIEHDNIIAKQCWKMSAALRKLTEKLCLLEMRKPFHRVYEIPRAIALIVDNVLIYFHGANEKLTGGGEYPPTLGAERTNKNE